MATLSMIAAMDAQRSIGQDNQMPWHLPADLRHFKERTLHKPVIMGRKTILSIGRALPRRENIVLSRQQGFEFKGCRVAQSIPEALELGGDAEEVMVIGGGAVYAQFLPMAQRIYLTELQHSFGGDTFFPKLPVGTWREVERTRFEADATSPCGYHFVTYERRV
jgi:dihydrofolate reductase